MKDMKRQGTGNKKTASAIGDKFAGLRKRSRIMLVIGTWLFVVTILLAFGL